MNKVQIAAMFAANAKRDRIIEPIQTPAGRLFVRKPTAFERDEAEGAYAAGSLGEGERVSYSACMVAACLCDEDGELVYDDQAEGRRVLSNVDADLLIPIFDVVARLCGLNKSARDTLAKNAGASGGDAECESPPLSDGPRRD